LTNGNVLREDQLFKKKKGLQRHLQKPMEIHSILFNHGQPFNHLFRITFSTTMKDQDVVFGINEMCKTNSLDKNTYSPAHEK
jgi:hypothetical protein